MSEGHDHGGGLGSLIRLPGGLGSIVADIRAIAEGMRILPQVAATLSSIERLTASMDAEVRRMREGVDQVNAEVGELGDRLEPHLAEMGHTLRPLRRVAGRMGIGRQRDQAARRDDGDANRPAP